ncbi:MAG TPA: geranylgeranylglyceryl/heptaprenylglyceryl phosphate synthase [Fibrobacteraceae bacterium]|nr:geranylgeranylglyceryl/heptaprenylglyceryl phosphate synthase [Fibrobacteraceae bacterium]
MIGKIESALNEKIASRGALFAVLLDPDTSDPTALLKAGSMAVENGADLLLVGGSFMGNANLPAQIMELKVRLQVPVILFPGGASQVVPGFDAILFTTLVSGRNPQYLIEEQVRGGVLIKSFGIEALPTAYALINSGKVTSVEYISNTRPIPADKPKLTMVHAVAAELMGMRWIYLEAGSGAAQPLPPEHISLVRKASQLQVIVGGGLVRPEMAAERVAAGAHVIVTGTIWEKVNDPALVREFAAAVHSKG